MESGKGISVVIPAHNAADVISHCLEALKQQTLPASQFEVIVVDDGSTDNSEAVVRQFPVFYIKVAHAGPAAARNQGLHRARGEVVAFTDADCIPFPDWLERLMAGLQRDGVVGVKGAYCTRQCELIARFAQIEYEEKYARMSRHEYIDFVDTYSAAYRREVLLEVGGFDTSFPQATGEDADLSFRLAAKGHRMVFEPKALVYHNHPNTLFKYWKRKFKQPYWRIQVLEKHPSKIKSDSHTPQTLKVQLGLFVLGVVMGVTSLLGLTSAKWVLVTAGLFLLSTLPFTLMALRRDLAVGLAAPLLLTWRASAFAVGTFAGVVAYLGRKGKRRWQWKRLKQRNQRGAS